MRVPGAGDRPAKRSAPSRAGNERRGRSRAGGGGAVIEQPLPYLAQHNLLDQVRGH